MGGPDKRQASVVGVGRKAGSRCGRSRKTGRSHSADQILSIPPVCSNVAKANSRSGPRNAYDIGFECKASCGEMIRAGQFAGWLAVRYTSAAPSFQRKSTKMPAWVFDLAFTLNRWVHGMAHK